MPITMLTSPTHLPKDIGLCDGCGTKNSKYAKTCHSCSKALPWAIPEKAAPVKAAAVNRGKPVFIPAGPPKNPAMKVVEGLGSVEWGGWIMAGLLTFLVFTLSTCLPVGLLMNYFMTKSDNWLRYPARCGLGLAVLVLMLGLMAAGHHHTVSP